MYSGSIPETNAVDIVEHDQETVCKWQYINISFHCKASQNNNNKNIVHTQMKNE